MTPRDVFLGALASAGFCVLFCFARLVWLAVRGGREKP